MASRVDHSKDDVAAISQAGKVKSEMLTKFLPKESSICPQLFEISGSYQKVFQYTREWKSYPVSPSTKQGCSEPSNQEFEELKNNS